MSRTIGEIQRDFALSSGVQSQIIWDSLLADQSDILRQKIKILIPDCDRSENVLSKMRANLFESVWAQRKYTNNVLLSAIIYVMVTEEENHELVMQSKDFSCHPVFRTRKCMSSNSSAGCCMIFIDESGRIYQNWKQYLQHNVLPKGSMVAPASGVYTLNKNNEVKLEIYQTPASSIKARILKKADVIIGIGSIAATIPVAATFFVPLAAPVIAAATIVTITSAAYTTTRSALQLKDRSDHGQSMTDRSAAGDWIGVVGGVVGIGAAGATKIVQCAATAGTEIHMAAKIAASGLTISSVLVSGSGVVHGVFDLYMKYRDDEEISGLDLLQLSSSLLVFTHSLNNLSIVSKLAKCSQGSSIRDELKRQLRHVLDVFTQEGSKLTGGFSKIDLIRVANDVPFKDILNNLHLLNTHLGGNNGFIFNPFTILPYILGNINSDRVELNNWRLAKDYGQKFVQHITNQDSMLNIMSAMAKYLCTESFHLFMDLAKRFIEKHLKAIDSILNVFISTETILHKILMTCVQNYKNFDFDFLQKRTHDILVEVENYFKSIKPINKESLSYNCKDCKGFYSVCTL